MAASETPIYTVHLEIRLKTHSTARADLIKQLVHKHVSADQQLYVPGEISGWQSEPRLGQNVHRIMACETCKYSLVLSSTYVTCARKDASANSLLTFLPACPTNLVDVAKAELEIHVYQPMESEVADMTTGKGGDDVIAATVTDLPCVEWDNLWDRYD
jgi:pachytene checkpoint protein 2